MYIQPQESPFDVYQPLSSLTPQSAGGGDLPGAAGGAFYGSPNSSDAISRFVPPWAGGSGGSAAYAQDGNSQNSLMNTLNNLLAQLGQMVQQLGGQLGIGSSGSSASPFGFGGFGANCPGGPCGTPQQFFQNASGESVGDPHLSFNGRHWSDMQSQPNLIDSDSFGGGYNVSTQTTAPNAKGVTYNQSASVFTDGGAGCVTLDNQGEATVSENGEQFALNDGQSFSMGDGESVSRADNGTVTISDANQSGGSITTTLTDKGPGVGVSVQANDVDLGGTLVNGPSAQAWQPPQSSPPGSPFPQWRRYDDQGTTAI